LLNECIAHSIRNQNTNIFRSVAALKCERRWCLTGTPIQNQIHDLHSLLRFLQIPNFQEKAYFQQHIVDMLKFDSVQGLKNLQLLMKGCCLRRTRKILPSACEIQEELRILEPSATEKKTYADITQECKEDIHQLINNKGSKKVYLTIIQTITRLRRLCNNGSIVKEQGIHDNCMDTDWDSSPQDPINMFDSFQRTNSAFCAHCEVEIKSLHDDQETGFGYVSKCDILLCGQCVHLLSKRKGNYNYCPFCDERQAHGESHLIIFPDVKSLEVLETSEDLGPAVESDAMDLTLDNDAPSTKISAVLFDVQNHPRGCKR